MIVMFIEQETKMLFIDERPMTIHFSKEMESFSLTPENLYKILNEALKEADHTRTILK